MKKLLLYLILFMAISCYKKDSKDYNQSGGGNNTSCGSHNGKPLYKDSGGCYFYSDSYGAKTYVELNECSC